MKKGFYFLFCCVFSLSAHAGAFDCIKALKSSAKMNQRTADRLSQAIVEGSTDVIKELATPWLHETDHDYSFSYRKNYRKNYRKKDISSSNNLLYFAAQVAIAYNSFVNDFVHFVNTNRVPGRHIRIDIVKRRNRDIIRGLKILVEMGFRFSAEDDKKSDLAELLDVSVLKTYGSEEYVTRHLQKILNILVGAGLTVESLYLSDGRSIVHEMLLAANPTGFKNILNSYLITQDNINLPLSIFYNLSTMRYQVFVAQDHLPFDYNDNSLLHWYASGKNADAEGIKKLQLLLEHGADPNLRVGVRNANSSKTTMLTPLELAKQEGNDPAVEVLLVEVLLKAGAKEVY